MSCIQINSSQYNSLPHLAAPASVIMVIPILPGSADLFGLACFLGPAVNGSRDLVISWTVEAEKFLFIYSNFFFSRSIGWL